MKTKLARLKTTVIRLLATLFIAVFAVSAEAQEWDFLSWHRVKVGGDLTKKLGLSVEQQLRLANNSSSIEQTFTELGLEYDLPKGFEISAAYRLSWSPEKDGSYSDGHRYNIDVSYGQNFWKLKAKLRARFQHKPSPYEFNDRREPDDSPMYVRTKLAVSYRDLKDWTPGLEFEIYFRTDNPKDNGIGKLRYRAFLDYDLPKRQELSLFYMLETDHTGDIPQFASIVGINYSFEWKRPKKNKDKK